MRSSKEVKKIETTIHCDLCGEEVNEGELGGFYFTGYSNYNYDSSDKNIRCSHQGYVGGDFCRNCIKLVNKAFSKIVNEYFYERYGAGEHTNDKLLDYIKENKLEESDY